MPRICTICSSPKRHDIDTAIASGQSIRSIATAFGINSANVYRHQKHATKTIAKVARAVERKSVGSIASLLAKGLDRTEVLAQRSDQIWQEAGDVREKAVAVKVGVQVESERRQILQTLGQATGEFAAPSHSGPTVVIVMPNDLINLPHPDGEWMSGQVIDTEALSD